MRGTIVLTTTLMQRKNGQPMHQYIASDELKSLIIHMCVQWYYLPTHPVTNNDLLGLWMHHSTNLVSLCRKCP